MKPGLATPALAAPAKPPIELSAITQGARARATEDPDLARHFPDEGEIPTQFAQEITTGQRTLIGGRVSSLWATGESQTVFSPIVVKQTDGSFERQPLGKLATMNREDATQALEAARGAWGKGLGDWPTLTPWERLGYFERFVQGLKKSDLREKVAAAILMEIAKPWQKSLDEFDRTVKFFEAMLQKARVALVEMEKIHAAGGVVYKLGRRPRGMAPSFGPSNYPVNESYDKVMALILLGNPVIMKLPKVGMLASTLLYDLFATSFPPGVINFFSGEGKDLEPVLTSGELRVLNFTGSTKVGNKLMGSVTNHHSTYPMLALGSKNVAIVAADAEIDNTVTQCVKGGFGYNQQRCTGIRHIFVHRSVAQKFIPNFIKAVKALKMGMPWEDGVQITPLYGYDPNPEWDVVRSKFAQMTNDAIDQGATLLTGGGYFASLVEPTVVYGINEGMKIYYEEQFYPLVTINVYDDESEVEEYMAGLPSKQQFSVFTQDPALVQRAVTRWRNLASRINLNLAPERGPDEIPFAGSDAYGLGTVSVEDNMDEASIPSVLVASAADRALLAQVSMGGDVTTALLPPQPGVYTHASSAPIADRPPPDRLVRGNPKRMTWSLIEDEARGIYTGTWSSDAGAWRFTQPNNQTEHFTLGSGKIRLLDTQGNLVLEVSAGQSATISPGFEGIFDVVEPVVKAYTVVVGK